MDEAKRLDAIPYDVKNVELGHHGKECSFEAILKKYKLMDNRALVLLGKIVNTDNTLYEQPEGPGLEAIAEGFRHLGYKDDHALNAAEWIVYDALYAYCPGMPFPHKLQLVGLRRRATRFLIRKLFELWCPRPSIDPSGRQSVLGTV